MFHFLKPFLLLVVLVRNFSIETYPPAMYRAFERLDFRILLLINFGQSWL